MPILEAERLFRFFHTGDTETVALADVSMNIEAGEVVAVTGPSGSGKSTLLACLAGLDEPSGGTVTVAGEIVSRRSETERAAIRARHVGVLWQQGNLLDHLRVRDNVALAQRLAHRTDASRVDDLLDQLGLTDRARAWPTTLSGGEAARAGLATALANDPSILLADEPTGELDSANAASVVAMLRHHATTGRAVVIVTHSDAVARLADRTIRLRDGKIEP